MTAAGRPRIGFLLDAGDGGEAHVSAVSREVIARLQGRGARVEIIAPQSAAHDIARLRPAHDLYVLKDKTPLILSLAGALTVAGARMVNSVDACRLARDKVAATAVLGAAGVPVPPSWATGSAARLRALLDDGPLWLKAPRGSRGVGVARLTSATALDAHAAPSDAHGLPLPLFAQREVPSAGGDLKVFVVGERTWAIVRRFPARTLEDKLGTPVSVPPAARAAALACGRALGLELYGVDFLRSEDGLVVVDVNALPGYKGAPEAPGALAEYLYGCAVRPTAAPAVALA
jgi:ribosomal protein S6--L-glutamate ligase